MRLGFIYLSLLLPFVSFSQKDTLSTKIIGLWELVSYKYELLPRLDSNDPPKFKTVKVGKRNGVYYYDFHSDNKVEIIYISSKRTCVNRCNWKVEWGKVIIEAVKLPADAEKSCQNEGYFFVGTHTIEVDGRDINYLRFDEGLYDKIGGKSVFQKISEIPELKK